MIWRAEAEAHRGQECKMQALNHYRSCAVLHHKMAPSASICQPRWYVVQCKSRQDDRAFENLERQGFQCYRPTRSIEKIRFGCKQDVQEPLFPSYLFIRLDSVNDNWAPIRFTRGVSKIVRFNEHPLPVDDRVIEEIRRRVANNSVKEPYFEPGDRVVIIDGSFSNVEAIFAASDGDQRVILLLTILHSEQNLTFPLQSVRKI